MTYGRNVCNKLKEIRQQIADQNDIAYETTECHFTGECQGTCPKCDAELRYIENEITKRKHLGKVATFAGISLGIATAFSACQTGDPVPPDPPYPGIVAPPIDCVYEDNGSGLTDDTVFMDNMKTEDEVR